MEVREKIGWKTRFVISKFTDPTGEIAQALKNGAPVEDFLDKMVGQELIEGNVALNEGLQQLIDILIGADTTNLYTNALARIGVGNSNTAEVATQTALIGTSTFAAMDVTYPSRTNQTVKFRGTFPTGQAEFAWEEYTVDNGSTPNKNLMRKTQSKGTKASGETWTLEVQITFS